MLASATRRDRPRRGSVGRSTGGAGQRLEADEHVGQAGASSQPPSPTAISVGGGRIAVNVRTAVESAAVSARRGTGPSASRLPASHTMRSAWAAPKPAPTPVRRAQQAVAEPAGRRRAERRADRFTDRDRADQAAEHDDRAETRVDRRRAGRRAYGSGRIGDAPPATAPSEPDDLRERARAQAEDDGDDDEQERDDVEGVHRPDRRTGRPKPPPGGQARVGRSATAGSGQSTVTSIGAAPPVVSLIVYVPGARSPRSTIGRLDSAISMHATSCGPWPSRRVMANVLARRLRPTIESRMLQGSTPLV